MTEILQLGGPAIWVIAGLSVFTLAVILWKLWHFTILGLWRRDAEDAPQTALGDVARAAHAASGLPWEQAQEATARVARLRLAEAGAGLRVLELIAVIAPLVGLLGTVLGMIDAFRVLEETGARADPGALAGGIWEALLTTAAGMAVAIPASAALTWFESLRDGLRLSIEDAASRILAPVRDA